jgi:hypothetical protein
LIHWAEQLAADGDWCGAYDQYLVALAARNDADLQSAANQAQENCIGPTEIPSITPTITPQPLFTFTPTITGLPPTDTVGPTETPSETPTPSDTPIPSDTPAPSDTPTVTETTGP